MALTIYDAPKAYAPAYNQMIFTLSSTNNAQSNFRYIADIYVNGSTSFTRLSCVANPTNGYGVFDVAGIIQTFLSRDPDDNTTTFKQCENSIAVYNVKFGEQYGPSSGITNYLDLTSSSGYCFNGIFEPNSFLSYNKTKYVLTNQNTNWLTDTPTLYTRVGEKLTAGFMAESSNDAYYLEIATYSLSGLQSSTTATNPYRTLANQKDRSINVDISYDYLSITFPALFNASTIYYTVQMLNGSSSAVSKKLTVNITETCTKYTPIRFKFMNNYGKYDYYTFTGAQTKNTDIKRNVFKQNPNSWSGTNYTYQLNSRGTSQYETVLNDTITIQSDWITGNESIWLEQLVTSPDVYVYIDNQLVAVNITASNYQTKYEVSEQLFNLSVSFQYSQNRKRQRR